MSACGRKRTLISRSHLQFERPLSGKEDIQELAVPEVLRNDGFAPVVSIGRRNTLTSTQKMACMLMNQRIRRGHYGDRESGAVGPLEASRGAEVDWASVWRSRLGERLANPHRLFITS